VISFSDHTSRRESSAGSTTPVISSTTPIEVFLSFPIGPTLNTNTRLTGKKIRKNPFLLLTFLELQILNTMGVWPLFLFGRIFRPLIGADSSGSYLFC